MGYQEKISENRRALKKCADISAHNVGASRAYYCAFIGIKKYLISQGYDYNQFLIDMGKCGEREYSHGTIKMALFKCLMDAGHKISNISQLNVLDNLYRKRRIADYEDKDISKVQFEDSMRELTVVEQILGVT